MSNNVQLEALLNAIACIHLHIIYIAYTAEKYLEEYIKYWMLNGIKGKALSVLIPTNLKYV